MDCSPPGSSVPGILQARLLERVAIPFSRLSSQPRDRIQVSCIAGRLLPEPPGKPIRRLEEGQFLFVPLSKLSNRSFPPRPQPPNFSVFSIKMKISYWFSLVMGSWRIEVGCLQYFQENARVRSVTLSFSIGIPQFAGNGSYCISFILSNWFSILFFFS